MARAERNLTMTTITDIRTIAIDVSDQDRALAFFTDTLGFEKRLDAAMSPTSRWIEVAPPGATTSIALKAAHAAMADAGVEVGELLRWPDVPPMFAFDDPDGNRFYLIEER